MNVKAESTISFENSFEDSAIALKGFASNHDYLVLEFAKLDLMLKMYTIEFRKDFEQMDKLITSNHVYISHKEVDFLLDEIRPKEREISNQSRNLLNKFNQLENKIDEQVDRAFNNGVRLPLPMLSHLFSLSYIELQLLLLCLAPELEHKYDKIFAYLQDDIARKRPSLELALSLLSQLGTNKWSLRALLNENSQLFKCGIIKILEDPHNPSGCSNLGKMLKLDERILGYILESDDVTVNLNKTLRKIEPLHCFEDVFLCQNTKNELQQTLRNHIQNSVKKHQNLIVNLFGKEQGEQIALCHAACADINSTLLLLDFKQLSSQEIEWQEQVHDCLRECLLQQVPLIIVNLSINKLSEFNDGRNLNHVLDMIDEYGWLTLIVSDSPCINEGLLRYRSIQFKSIKVPTQNIHEQREVWKHYSQQFGLKIGQSTIQDLTNKFNLNSLQIYNLIKLLSLNNEIHNYKQIDQKLIENLCRSESNHSLDELAVRVKPNYSWSDIVLPENIFSHLKTICNQVGCQNRVFQEWGFETKISYGKGVSALFSGPPGTGKTMAAQVIANELGLDLYKIDLASVVSKYIGETEKNLEKIFKSAEQSNAILLFDECDAIFGKRTEVSDSHDRYANIEVSFLLQKMEDYSGIVLLTTNLKKNMDDAFVRRIRFIIEFPFPDKASREKIWQCHFPSQAPLADEVSFATLAEKFSVSGGSIKNIVLNAAFFAANSNSNISMEHLLESTRNEFEKIGKMTHSFN